MSEKLAPYKEEERRVLLKCIETYKSLPVLWKVTSKEYSNRDKRNEAYNILLKVYRELCPQATKDDVKKRINSLRTNFRKQLKKLHSSKESGQNFVSPLWYFNDMLFIINQETYDDLTTITKSEPGVNDICTEYLLVPDSPKIFNDPSDSEIEEPISKRSRSVQCSQEEFCHFTQDNYEHLAKMWVNDLKKMNPLQQIFAKKYINDILYEGQLGSLDRNSVTINGPSCSF